MQFKQTDNKKYIKEFLDLVENHKVEIRRYKNPILVWAVDEGVCYYSFWEEEILQRFGLENVDGWDFEEDALFCPDWVVDEEEEEDLEDDEDDEELCAYCKKIQE